MKTMNEGKINMDPGLQPAGMTSLLIVADLASPWRIVSQGPCGIAWMMGLRLGFVFKVFEEVFGFHILQLLFEGFHFVLGDRFKQFGAFLKDDFGYI